ncbi:MAG: glycosyltransferase, partial [Bacteroidales bacterium]
YPDLVHAHFTRIAAMASVLKKTHKIPFVITEHSSKMIEPTLSKELIYYAEKAYFNADEVVCVSKSLADNLYEKFKINCKLIPNIVDTDKISYRPMDHSKFTFISVGNLIQRKGFDILLSAFRNMKNVDTQLHIIGSGEERGNLQNFINTHELNTRVKLLGYKNREEIAGIMNMGDAFVLASKRETFGVVFIEAMLAGLPVVATRCGGPENFINKSNGI